ncbi:MAG TPA: hypothetical protein VM939_07845 [Gemmatimonadaceae bacterium]|nr:hypothetical protein [Gemmatimonadaceae bacterium]
MQNTPHGPYPTPKGNLGAFHILVVAAMVCSTAQTAGAQAAGQAASAAASSTSESTVKGPMSIRAEFNAHNAAAAAARTRKDWPEVRKHLAAIDNLMHGSPGIILALARTAVWSGDKAAAFAELKNLIGMGLTREIARDTSFASLHADPEWAGIVAGFAANTKTIGGPEKAFELPSADFIAEDIAYDAARDRFLVTSVRNRTIVAVKRGGSIESFAAAADLWGMMAIAADAKRNVLWATTVAMPRAAGYNKADAGKASVLKYDLASGKLLRRFDLPANERGSIPGDIAVSANGDLFVSDGRTGVIHVIRENATELRVLVAEGTFLSPQGPAVTPDGKTLYVADYQRGLAEVDQSTGAVTWLSHPRNVAVAGIDGLIAADDRTLIAVQNGVMPNRVIEFKLDAKARAITGYRVLAQNPTELRGPTHGVLARGALYFIGNGGFDDFDDEGKPAAGVTPSRPVVYSLKR